MNLAFSGPQLKIKSVLVQIDFSTSDHLHGFSDSYI